ELPTYEIMGFPVTQHQVMVLGSSHIEERTPTPALTLAGMPASPHQIAVLTPRNTIDEQQIARKLTRAGFSQVRLVPLETVSDHADRLGPHLLVSSDTRSAGLHSAQCDRGDAFACWAWKSLRMFPARAGLLGWNVDWAGIERRRSH